MRPLTVSSASRNLSLSYKQLGAVLEVLKARPEAIPLYEKALDLDRRRVAAEPSRPIWRLDLSFAYGAIGAALMSQGDLPGALARYEEAVRLRRAVVAEDPGEDFAKVVARAGLRPAGHHQGPSRRRGRVVRLHPSTARRLPGAARRASGARQRVAGVRAGRLQRRRRLSGLAGIPQDDAPDTRARAPRTYRRSSTSWPPLANDGRARSTRARCHRRTTISLARASACAR